VSKLHGEVSRGMFSHLFPGVDPAETPIGSVTNGVHGFTWVSPEINDLFTRHLVPSWPEADAATWAQIDRVADDELWRVKEQGRSRLVEFVRGRLRKQALARRLDADVSWCAEALDPRILTIGFARRFATYKRADLLLSQPERLERLLLSAEQPLQLVFAGKAHPADDHGKELIRRIAQFARRPEVRHRVAFVEDYDIAVARLLYQGSDVWLNNPRRPAPRVRRPPSTAPATARSSTAGGTRCTTPPTAGPSPRPRPSRTSSVATTSRSSRSSTSWSSRSCRCSTTAAAAVPCRAAGCTA
jgi:starch phosphorylase